MRAQGKGFDAFYQRAKDKGVSFIRSRPSYIKEDPLTDDLLICWEDEGGKLHESRYDMVVLSAGLEPARKAQEAAGHLGIALNRHGFCELQEFNPLESSRQGVFVVGPFGEPKDIPDSVAQASAAAAQVMTGLADSRGTLTVDKEYPAERDVTGEEPRVGVFVCHCGSNIAGVIDVENVAEYALTLPGVEYATDTMYTCSSDSLTLIREKIEEHQLNRVVVASCTPRTHEPIFQDTLREAGLNPFLFEMANIRDQASWVHNQEPAKATGKARDLVRMSVARARMLEPLFKIDVPLTHAAVVLGGGIAGMTAANALGDMGHEVHLVERTPKLGGHALALGATIKGGDPADYVAALERRLVDNPNVRIHLEAELADFHGFIGNFSSVIADKDGKRTPIDHGVVVVATGSREDRPELYGLGESAKVVTGMDLERMLKDRRPRPRRSSGRSASSSAPARSTRPIRTARAPAASRASRTPSRLKEQDPDRPVYVWFKEVRTFGLLEEYYTKARELGVIFTRYDNDSLPQVSANGSVAVAYRDPYLGRDVDLPLDLLVLATPTIAGRGQQRAEQAAQGAAAGRRLLSRGARQAAPRGLRLRGHLPLRRRPLPQEHRGEHQPGVRRGRTGRRHPGQARHQGRRRRRRGRPGEVRRLPHLRARLPLRGADHRPRREEGQDRGGRLPGLRDLRERVPGEGDHAAPLHRRADLRQGRGALHGGELTWPTPR